MRKIFSTVIILFTGMLAAQAQQPANELLPFRSAAPSFSLSSTNGKQIKLSDCKGKMIVFYCWDNQDKNDHGADTIRQAWNANQEDTAMIFVAVTRKPVATGILPKNSRVVNVVIPANSTDANIQQFIQHYKISSLPRTILIGRQGDILAASLPEGQFDAFVKMFSLVEDRSDANHTTFWDYKVKVGDLIPGNMKLKVVDGKAYTMADLRGQVVLMEFTASWCGVCRELMPHLEKEFWQAYKNKGLKVFGIDLKETPATIRKFAATVGVTYPMVEDDGGKIFYHFAKESAGVTKVVLLDKTGHIVYMSAQKMEAEEQAALKAKIESML
ncbi:TlpA disulfide reductase family protein [Chitinophaga sp. Cy-1792]|uniref:TlpA disulfide reductase family protein n=1 Tax=Chitinophaga sp. Cy-1792 TaxID=2608339 RepID=UPI0014221393|nr:TlpA disulfide reductase family protein [Chitinophaga sp. Cy-1792]NIG55023.1 redoxin domain-containing protein [Chitinophaga sp. Cy-1792]